MKPDGHANYKWYGLNKQLHLVSKILNVLTLLDASSSRNIATFIQVSMYKKDKY